MSTLSDSDSDDDYTSRQHEYMRPWVNRAPADGYGRNAALANPGSEEWEKRGYRDNAGKFRKDVRDVVARGQYADGTTGDERYGGKPTVNADVGHVFSDMINKAAQTPTGGNIYKQGGFNRTIGERCDELNVAMVGRQVTNTPTKLSTIVASTETLTTNLSGQTILPQRLLTC